MTPREKHQKFKILDAPSLLNEDLAQSSGMFGPALLYLDLDGFKSLNTKYTERVVDQTLLPEFQRLIASAVEGHGFAYAEGGDEVIILLRSASQEMAVAFAESLRAKIGTHQFSVPSGFETMTVSIGLATRDGDAAATRDLPDRANVAKAHAKTSGKDCTCVWSKDGSWRVGGSPEPAEREIVVTPRESTVFFNDRVCQAFPGTRGLAVFESASDIIERLSELLKDPLEFRLYAPIWTMTGRGDMYLKRFEVIDGSRVRIQVHRYLVKRMAVYRGSAYWQDFVYFEYGADAPTGLYPPLDPETKAYLLERLGGCTEEYALWREELITREEYDDAAVMRNGKSVPTDGAKLEVRHLTPGALIIAAQRSPIHSRNFETELREFMTALPSGSVQLPALVARVEQLDRVDGDDL